MTNSRRLAYFDRWFDKWSNPDVARILTDRDDITLIGLEFDGPEPGNWAEMAQINGYQIAPRTELQAPWFGDRNLIARCPHLLAICTTGSGYDVVDVPACSEAGIIVCNQAGANKEAVAEHALGMMLTLSKKIAFLDRHVRRKGRLDRRDYQGNDLLGKTVGIVGLGHIGTRTAELCVGLFKMTVLAYDPYLSADEIARRHAIKVDLDELFRRADFVSVHCPRSAETMGMIGRQQFALMKPSAYFVTTARGGVHDEVALAGALAEGRIAGAGLDVFLEEPPLPDHPLLAFDNVVATPHIAGTTAESIVRMATGNARQWIDIFDGRVPPRLINPEAWHRYADRFERAFGARPLPLEAGR